MCADVLEPLSEEITALLAELGFADDASDLVLLRLLRIVANQSDNAVDSGLRKHGLTAARLRVLLFLIAAEKRGALGGASPTVMSQQQQVAKTTMSTLVRGLEEQGLVERKLDPNDKRFFHFRVTEAGKDLAHSVAPRQIAFLEHVMAVLDTQERHQLATLLGKLHQSFLEHSPGSARAGESSDDERGLAAHD